MPAITRSTACTQSPIDAYTTIDTFLRFYNDRGPHSALGTTNLKTKMEVYRQCVALAINQRRPDQSDRLQADSCDKLVGSCSWIRPSHQKRQCLY